MKNYAFLFFCLLSLYGTSQEAWITLNSPTERNFECVYFTSPTNCYIGGDSVLVKTIDGGENFEVMDLSDVNPLNNQTYVISDMHWDNMDEGWIVLSDWGGLFKTDDGGQTWNSITPAGNGFCQFKSIEKSPSGRLFLGGAGCFSGALIDYFDNGVWQSATLPENWDTSDIVNTINFYNENLGSAGTSTGKILRTTDGGLNWSYVDQNVVEDINITDFEFASPDKFVLCYAAPNGNFGFLESTDLGETWGFDIDLSTFFYPNIHGAYLSDEGSAYFVGAFGTQNDEQGFITSYPSPQNLTANEVLKDVHGHGNTIFAVGNNGSILARPAVVSSSEAIALQRDFVVFPNPNEGVFHLSYLNSNWTHFEVLMANGQLVYRGKFTDGIIGNGTLKISDLPSGLYHLNCHGSALFESTRFIVK